MANKQKTNPDSMKRYKAGTDIPSQSNFEPEYCQKIIECGKRGESFSQFCASIGKSKRVVIDWRKKYPIFEEAYQDFVLHARAWWESLGKQYIVTYQGEKGEGEKFDTALYKFITGGRFGMSHQPDIDLPGLESGSLDSKHRVALRALARGAITPNQAAVISQMLKDAIDIEAHGEMKDRLLKVEEHLGIMENKPIAQKVADEPEYEEVGKDGGSYGGTSS